MKQLIVIASRRRIVVASLKTAAVVGALLNLINHGERMVHGVDVSWFHVALNFVVPYCVASYSAAKNELAKEPMG